MLLAGSAYGVLLVVWLAVEEIPALRRAVCNIICLFIGAAVRIGLID